MKSNASSFYLDQPEPNRSCLLALRDIILAHNSHISETVKYGMPCFVYGKKALCYLWQDKKTKEPYVLFVDGNKMDHPELESGDRARMKIFRVDANADIPIKTLHELLELAIELQSS
jgi:hypothetical protein